MDRILSLSTFGDVRIPKKGKEKSWMSEPNDGSNYSSVFSKVLQNMAQTKLLHWQSALYGQHKALDELFGNIISIGDTLAESIMGKYGKPVLKDDELCLKLKNFNSPENGDLKEFMDHLYKCYSDDCRCLFDKDEDPEIINIIDELLSAVDQTRYLLSLR